MSIVLPVFKVEKYIERCIRSLENQDIPHQDYELIVVNDGSPDNSKEVVTNLMKEFSNILLINQANQGVSVARNVGIEKACGRYILFIDPDDYVIPNTFLKILSSASQHDSEVTFLGYTFLSESGVAMSRSNHTHLKNQLVTGTEAYFLSRGNGQWDPDRSVAVLFEREFVNRHRLRYTQGVPYLEDGEFLVRVLCLAKKCGFDDTEFYQRTTRPGSATNSKMILSTQALMGFFKAAERLKQFRESESLTEEQRKFVNQPIAKFTLLPLNTLAINYKWKEFNDLMRQEYLRGRKLDLRGVKKTYLRYGRVFNKARWFLFYYMILNVHQRIFFKRFKRNLSL